MPKKELTDLTVQVHAETAKAVLVSNDGDRDKAVWLPFSPIEIDTSNSNYLQITLPEWLAQDKGLI